MTLEVIETRAVVLYTTTKEQKKYISTVLDGLGLDPISISRVIHKISLGDSSVYRECNQMIKVQKQLDQQKPAYLKW